MTIEIPIADLKLKEQDQYKGFCERCMKTGMVQGDVLVIEVKSYDDLKRKKPPKTRVNVVSSCCK